MQCGTTIDHTETILVKGLTMLQDDPLALTTTTLAPQET